MSYDLLAPNFRLYNQGQDKFTGTKFSMNLLSYNFEEYFQSLFFNTSSPNQVDIYAEICIFECSPYTCKYSDYLLKGNGILKVGYTKHVWPVDKHYNKVTQNAEMT